MSNAWINDGIAYAYLIDILGAIII